MNNFISFLNEHNICFERDKSLSELTTFKTGGPAFLAVFPKTADELSAVYENVIDRKLNYYILGRGSNVVALDSGYDGIVISTENVDDVSVHNETYLTCTAGTSLTKLCRFALQNSLTGLEFAYGIPGTAGGAVYMNAGAYGGEIKDVITECTYIDDKKNIKTVTSDKLELGYRKSFFTEKPYLILSLTLKLKKGDSETIKAKMDELMSRRKEKQPLEFPSAGSTFKRPEGYYAGALIEECGLKGYSYGGAKVSEKHSGFVINYNGATASDILEVVRYCQETVYRLKGVRLETEIKLLK